MIRLNWFIQPPVVIVASALGLVDSRDFEGAHNRSSDEQFDALTNGDVDLVVTAMDNVIAWNQRQGPGDFRIVAQIERTTPLHLFARPGIQVPADVHGGIALVDATDNGFVIALRALLADVGLSADDYALRPAGGVRERLDALLAGQGDCTLLGPPFDSMATQAGFERIATVQQHYPAFPGQGLVTRKSFIGPLRAQLTPWLCGLANAAQRMAIDDPAAKQALADAGNPATTLTPIASMGPNSLVPDRAGVELLIAMRRRLGLAGADDTYDMLIDSSLLS